MNQQVIPNQLTQWFLPHHTNLNALAYKIEFKCVNPFMNYSYIKFSKNSLKQMIHISHSSSPTRVREVGRPFNIFHDLPYST